MRVLLIDDEENSVQAVVAELDVARHAHIVKNFAECDAKFLEEWHPDIVVLDLKGSLSDAEGKAGNEEYAKLWEQFFVPIIVYSATPSLLNAKHPMVSAIEKGKGSESAVLDKITKLGATTIRDMSSMHADVHRIVSHTLRDVAPLVYGNADIVEKEQNLKQMTRRRIAAAMDNSARGCPPLQPWEIFIVPPIEESLLFGDILCKKSDNNFYIILTPSCDLVNNGQQKAVEHVLCAECIQKDYQQVFEKCGISAKPSKPEKLQSALNQGYAQEYFFIPRWDGMFPALIANLKQLKFIPFSDITNKTSQYIRYASIDSPFREQLAWAYMNTSCRPGVPTRDVTIWASQYVQMDKKPL